MTTRIVLLESQIKTLRELVFDTPGVEGAAFVLCGQSVSGHVTKLIGHAVVAIRPEDIVERGPEHLCIASRALMRIAKLAQHERLSILFAHSHPAGVAEFSQQDDREELKLIPFLQGRVPDRVHGTLVLTETDIRGRIYSPHRTEVDAVVSVGRQFMLWPRNGTHDIQAYFDRQVRAFGPAIQDRLSQLHVGIVGLGGTGSPVAEQLCRLGVGRLSLFDGDSLDATNVNRVYGSHVADANKPKVQIAKVHLDQIGLGTVITPINSSINKEHVARALRDCDIVFGCTDKETPRAILTQLALRYTIPVFDLGVLINSVEGKISDIYGRVTTLMPGNSCLFCRGRISAEAIRLENLSTKDRQMQVRDGYAPELDDEPAPAVIAFTSATASLAVSELLHRLTGFMGPDRDSSEVLAAFDQSRIRTNRVMPNEQCTCADMATWGRGDTSPFLEMVWA